MKLLQLLVITILLFSMGNCKSRKDETREKAILTYLVACKGGSLSACNSDCAPSCGIASTDAITPEKLPCVSSCQSSCSTNCSGFSILFTFIK